MREIVELTKKLIRFPSVHSRPDEIQRCITFIEGYLQEQSINFERQTIDGIPSLWAMPAGRTAPVLLMSHVDVVDAPDELFEPYEKDGKLFGRGSLDDKYAVALSLVLLKNQLAKHKANGLPPQALPFGILITGDEEIGGHNGAQPALRKLETNFCIALDGGEPEQMVIQEKGLVKLKLIAHGKSAHGSRPWLGNNAIENLFDDWLRIKAFFTAAEPDRWHRTINFGIIRAGQSENQVPDRGEAIFDLRYTENDDVDGLIRDMTAAIRGELQVMAREPLFDAGESPYFDLLRRLVPGARLIREHGASDARFLAEKKTPGLVWGASGGSSSHAQHEHVTLNSLERLYGYLDAFMDSLSAQGIETPGISQAAV